jgi:formate/nitrite transporter FocA (FNT family)
MAALAGMPMSGAEFLGNLVPVTIGSMIGGGVLVGLVCWIIYVRPRTATEALP